jgi:hypothetical protein
VKKVVAEWHHVLRLGGILRVAVPNFKALVEVYPKYKDLNLVYGTLYGRWEIPSSTGPIIIYHKTCYDFVSLQRTLSDSGFINIHKYD